MPHSVEWAAELPDSATISIRTNGVVLGKAPVASLREFGPVDIETYVLDEFGAGTYVCAAHYNGGIRSHTRFMVGRREQSRWGNSREETVAALGAGASTASPLDDIKKVADILAPAAQGQRDAEQQEREFGHSLVLEFVRSQLNQPSGMDGGLNQLESLQRLNTLMTPAPHPKPDAARHSRRPPLMERITRTVSRAVHSIGTEQAADLIARGVDIYQATRSRRARAVQPIASDGDALNTRDGPRPDVAHVLLGIPGAEEWLAAVWRLTREGSPDDVAATVARWLDAAKERYPNDRAVADAVQEGARSLLDATAEALSMDDSMKAQLHARLAPPSLESNKAGMDTGP